MILVIHIDLRNKELTNLNNKRFNIYLEWE